MTAFFALGSCRTCCSRLTLRVQSQTIREPLPSLRASLFSLTSSEPHCEPCTATQLTQRRMIPHLPNTDFRRRSVFIFAITQSRLRSSAGFSLHLSSLFCREYFATSI